MKLSPWLEASVMLLWGFSMGLPVWGASLALLRLALPWIRVEMALSDDVMRGLVAFLFLVSLALLVTFGVMRGLPGGLFAAVSWLPLVWMVLLVVADVNLSPLSLEHFVVKSRRTPFQDSGATLSFSGPFVALSLLAASVVQTSSSWFFWAAFFVLCAWVYVDAPRKGAKAAAQFAIAALLAAGCAWTLGAGLRQAQNASQDVFAAAFGGMDNNPFKSQTQIGDIGRIQLSDQIVWRADLPPRTLLPVLLRSGVFTRYVDGQWLARPGTFSPLQTSPGTGPASLRLHGSRQRGGLLLPLPMNAGALADASGVPGALGTAERNTNGIVRLTEGPSLLDVQVWPSSQDNVPPPEPADLAIPRSAVQWVTQIAELDAVRGQGEARRLEATRAWFASRFSYTLYLGNEQEGGRNLERFLFKDRAGHCEYFATATVLLLRAQGIPARYVTGFVLQEYSELEQAHVVRMSHAHAWVQAYVNGRWVEADTTPSSWLSAQENRASAFKPVWDALSYAWYRLSRVMHSLSTADAKLSPAVMALLLGLVAALILRRLRVRRKTLMKQEISAASEVTPTSATLQTLLVLEREWSALGLGRRTGETPRAWLRRIAVEGASVRTPENLDEATRVVEAFYMDRYRQD
jgi:transglutaminase-like putative cysteine protease